MYVQHTCTHTSLISPRPISLPCRQLQAQVLGEMFGREPCNGSAGLRTYIRTYIHTYVHWDDQKRRAPYINNGNYIKGCRFCRDFAPLLEDFSGPSISVFCGQLSGDKFGLSIFFGGALALRRLSKAASGGSTRFLTSAWRDPKRHSKLDSIFRAFGQISMPFCAFFGRRTMAEARKRERCGKGIGGGNASRALTS